MSKGIFVREYRYDTQIPTSPIQMQAGMSYRILSRQPVNLTSDDFSYDRVNDEIIHIEKDCRMEIQKPVVPAAYGEYVSIIGRQYQDLGSEKFGFKSNQYIYGAYVGASPLVISLSTIAPWSRLRSMLLDEISLIIKTDGAIAGYTDGILSVTQEDINTAIIYKMAPNHKILYDVGIVQNLVSTSFHWQAMTDLQSLLVPKVNIVVAFNNVSTHVIGIDYYVKGRCF